MIKIILVLIFWVMFLTGLSYNVYALSRSEAIAAAKPRLATATGSSWWLNASDQAVVDVVCGSPTLFVGDDPIGQAIRAGCPIYQLSLLTVRLQGTVNSPGGIFEVPGDWIGSPNHTDRTTAIRSALADLTLSQVAAMTSVLNSRPDVRQAMAEDIQKATALGMANPELYGLLRWAAFNQKDLFSRVDWQPTIITPVPPSPSVPPNIFTTKFKIGAAANKASIIWNNLGDHPYTASPTVATVSIPTGVSPGGQFDLCVRFFLSNNTTSDSCERLTFNPTISPPAPPPDKNCVCQANNTCTPACALNGNKLSSQASKYSDPIKCSLDIGVTVTAPTQANKDAWCNTAKRTKGDANNDGAIDTTDYTLWLRATNGGRIPTDRNPDFSGDGEVGRSDLDIWQAGRGQ